MRDFRKEYMRMVDQAGTESTLILETSASYKMLAALMVTGIHSLFYLWRLCHHIETKTIPIQPEGKKARGVIFWYSMAALSLIPARKPRRESQSMCKGKTKLKDEVCVRPSISSAK